VKEHPQLVVMTAEGCISLTAAAQLEVQAGSKEAAVSLLISDSSINSSALDNKYIRIQRKDMVFWLIIIKNEI
jgi:hypothetical protein